MAKKIKIEVEQYETIRKCCSGYEYDYLLKAINEYSRQSGSDPITVEETGFISHVLLVDLAFTLLLRTSIFDADKKAYFIDEKGYYCIEVIED